jgi:DNA invertase Pin-like site-specific DNA recombinase
MNTIPCFECGRPASVQHHVIPRSKQGTKTIPLCNECHSLVHDAKLVSIAELSLRGKEIARSLQNREKVVQLHLEGTPKTEIAKKIGIGRHAVYSILEEYGLHINEGKGCEIKVTPELLDQIKNMRESGLSWNQIETDLDICHTHLYRIIKEHGWIDGKYGGTSKKRETYITLDDAKIEQAKALRAENKTWEEISHIIGVDRTTLYKHGVAQQFKPLRGKMTEEKKQQARKLRADGKTWNEIALILEVSINAIYFHRLHKEE